MPQAGFHINGDLALMFPSSPIKYQLALRHISEERKALSEEVLGESCSILFEWL